MSSSSSDNARLIETLYTCFQRRDPAGMLACYHPQAHFSDPVFPELKGKQVGAMWHMLLERGKDLAVQFSAVQAQGDHGQAHWEATYTFSGRKVHNSIDAAFTFQDGRIIRHQDHFDLWRWSRMALGGSGVVLGWSPLVQNKIRKTAQDGLLAFIAKHPEYQS